LPHENEILKLLAEHGSIDAVVDALLRSPRKHRELIEYLLRGGLVRAQHHMRKTQRSRIMAEELSDGVRPVAAGAPRYDYPNAKLAIRRRTLTMLASWPIGNTTLDVAYKHDLLREAKHERSSGNGHFGRAKFYEALAQPMDDTQQVKDCWEDEGARLLRQSILDELEKRGPPPPDHQGGHPPDPPRP
jgi:hypothetical protein